MIIKLVTIHVSNLENSLKFYTENLKLKEVRRIDNMPGMTLVFLQDKDGGVIELIYKEAEVDKIEVKESIVAFAFEVENMEKTKKELEANGVEIVRGPLPLPSGEKIMFINDPDGVSVEFIEGFKI